MAPKSKEEIQVKEQLKSMSKKERLHYFWYYYKVHTLVTLVVLILIGFFIRTELTKKDIVLNVAMINTYSEMDSEVVAAQFLPEAGFDPAKTSIYFDSSFILNTEQIDQTSMASNQKLTAMTFAGELDSMICDETVIDYFYQGNYFKNLEEILPDTLIENHQDNFIYREYIDEDTSVTKQIPVGIDISDCPKFKEWNLIATDKIYFTFISSAKHSDTTLQFFNYLYTEKSENS